MGMVDRYEARITIGDIFLASKTLPNADAIISRSYVPEEGPFSVSLLGDLLRFLELVVLHERLLIIECPIESKLIESLPASDQPQWIRIQQPGELNIADDIRAQLTNNGILIDGYATGAEKSARSVFENYLRVSPFLRRRVQESLIDLNCLDEWPRELRHEIAFIDVFADVADSLYIPHLASETHFPYAVSMQDHAHLMAIEKLESRLQYGVMTHIRQNFNSSVQKEIERLDQIGGPIIYPRTPIAWQIISNAATPADLIRVTLELRNAYSTFRHNINVIEAELRSPDITLRRKLRLISEIEAMLVTLAPNADRSLRQEALAVSAVVTSVPVPSVNLSQAKFLLSLLDRPLDVLLKALRRRKVRVLLRSKRTFLRSSRWASHIAKLFGVNKRIVERSLAAEPIAARTARQVIGRLTPTRS
jgi:hypothetical protein